ncbi:MAG: HlyC/CorC family transporter [Bacteroidales bacterium]|nr:MAG: HlyC/CorC family transporter [Bacteroidales bacterium]
MSNLTIIIISLLFSAFFSGMEIAFVASNKLRIELDKKQGLLSSKLVSIFTSHPGQYITTMLVGNTIALVIYGSVMAKVLEPVIIRFISSSSGLLATQTIISTLIILITAEFLPKTLVRINPNQVLKFLSAPGVLFYILFYPITGSTIWIINIIITAFFSQSPPSIYYKNRIFGKVDLDYLISEGREDSDEEVHDENDIKLFQNALEFSNVKLRDCMVPRAEIVAMEINSSVDELSQRFIETGFSKILIYNDTIDNILGYISSKELFKNPSDIKSGLIKISFVPETMAANKLLRKLIQEKKSIAAVVDEFGGISGMVTIEDIIEEIFGEIVDEHDTIDLVERQLNDKEFVFSGRLEIDYINEKYKLNIKESEEYDTLAGFIFYHYEKIPKMNERFTIDNFKFNILKVSKTRIEIIQLSLIEND